MTTTFEADIPRSTAYSALLPNGASVAMRHPEAGDEWSANAQLIAAAPDLLSGCQAALAYLADPPSTFVDNREEAVRIIRAAIAKAEGGAA